VAYKIERQNTVEADLIAITEFLVRSGEGFGQSTESALQHAATRLDMLLNAIHRLSLAPYRGTLRPALGDGVRNVTMDRFIIYFEIDEDRKVMRILAIFYGGQDHMRQMLLRMLR
jgi:toxin ParE1/3/4